TDHGSLDRAWLTKRSPERAHLSHVVALVEAQKGQSLSDGHRFGRAFEQPVGGDLLQRRKDDGLRPSERVAQLAQRDRPIRSEARAAPAVGVARRHGRRPGPIQTQQRVDPITAPQEMADDPVGAVAAWTRRYEGLLIAHALEVALERGMGEAIDDYERSRGQHASDSGFL